MDEAGVTALERTERAVIDALRKLALYIATPFAVYAVGIALWEGSDRWALWLWVLVQVPTYAVLFLDIPRQRRIEVFAGGLVAGGAMTLIQYGTHMAVAFAPLFAASVLAIFGAGRPWWPVLALALEYTLGTLAVHLGWLSFEHRAEVPGDTVTWARTGFSNLMVVFVVYMAIARTMGWLRAALENEEAARRELLTAAEERERMIYALASEQHLEALGRLTSGAVHDCNNVLTVISNGVDELRRDPAPRERAQILDDVASAANGAAATVRQLLVTARHDPGEDAACHPSDVLNTLGRALPRLLPDDISVVVEAPPELPPIPIPAGILQQALLNLALNARDALPEGGAIHLVATLEEECVEIGVEDDGVGMDSGTISLAPRPFFTTKPPGKGTGLGLAMVKNAVEGAGGLFELRSRPAEGTRVVLHFPIATRAPAPKSESPPGPLTSLDVLIMEDQPELRRTLVRALRQAGHRVVDVDCVAAGLEALATREVEFDILVTDGVVTDGSATPVIERFRDELGAPIIVASGHSLDELLERGFPEGDFRYIAKPFSMRDLLLQIAKLTHAASRTSSGRRSAAPVRVR